MTFQSPVISFLSPPAITEFLEPVKILASCPPTIALFSPEYIQFSYPQITADFLAQKSLLFVPPTRVTLAPAGACKVPAHSTRTFPERVRTPLMDLSTTSRLGSAFLIPPGANLISPIFCTALDISDLTLIC